MRTIQTNIYSITDHPNKELCFNWIRDNRYDIGQHDVDEVIYAIIKLSKVLGCICNYSISAYADRGEHITFIDYDNDILQSIELENLDHWDYIVTKSLQKNNTRTILESIHNNTEYLYSDEALQELCENEENEFLEDGTFYVGE